MGTDVTGTQADSDGDAAVPSDATGSDGAVSFGTFRYDQLQNRMTWSDELFPIFGLKPGEVMPSAGLVVSHIHHDDRARWNEAIQDVLATGAPVAVWHRIVDARRRVRSVLTVASPTAATVVDGTITDLTQTLRRETGLEASRAVLESAASRDLIEQAKGMLMVIFDLSDAQAFELLRWHSSNANVKLRHVAAALVDRLVDPELAGLQPRQRLTRILADLRPPTAAPVRPELVQQPPVPERPLTQPIRRIPTADLPRTLTRAIGAAAQSITIVDWQAPDQPLVYVNEAFAALTGYPAEQILGRNCRFLQGPETDPAAVELMRQALTHGREIRTVVRNYRRDGSAFWNEVHLSAVRDQAGRITHYVGYQSDVSERVEREQQLRHIVTSRRNDLPG